MLLQKPFMMEHATICLQLHHVLIVVHFSLRKLSPLTHLILESYVISIVLFSKLCGAKSYPQSSVLFQRESQVSSLLSGNPQVGNCCYNRIFEQTNLFIKGKI